MKTLDALLLGKLLATFAWADNSINEEEQKILDDFVFSQTNLSVLERLSVKLYFEYPITAEEQTLIIEEASGEFKDPSKKELACFWLQKMVCSDFGKEDYQKSGLFVLLMENWKVASEDVYAVDLNQSRREDLIEPFLSNPIYYRFHWHHKDLINRISDRTLRKVCSEFSLIARVAQADENVHQDEKDVILDILSVNMDLNPRQVAAIFEMALNLESEFFFTQSIVKSYTELTTIVERRTFVELLFEVIIADGIVHPCEKDLLNDIAIHLDVPRGIIKDGIERIEKAVQKLSTS